MKLLRVILVSGLTAGILIFAFFWSRSDPQRYETPTDCVSAFYQAAKDKDENALLRCLRPELHSEASSYVSEKQDLMSLVRYAKNVTDDTSAIVEIHEVRKTATHRVRVQLKKLDRGWCIVSFGAPELIKTDVPYGTSLNEVPDP